MIRYRYLALGVLGCLGLLALVSCTPKDSTGGDSAGNQATVTPVRVTRVLRTDLADDIILNATSAFLRKNYIKSNVNGYVVRTEAVLGMPVRSGQPLFELQTKEAHALSQDSLVRGALSFSGMVTIRASKSGFISDLFHQQGDYVQDGEPLCNIADQGSFVFLLDVPFEDDQYIRVGMGCNIGLPDGRVFRGVLAYRIPMVDPVSQTERYVLKLGAGISLPENLIARVRIRRRLDRQAVALPRGAVLTNETQDAFWIMKMINDSTAIRVPVQTGIQNDSLVEILSPVLGPSDRILVSGNYGLGDTAQVRVFGPN